MKKEPGKEPEKNVSYEFNSVDLNKNKETFFKLIKEILELEDENDYIARALVSTFTIVHIMPKKEAFNFLLHQIKLSVYILRGWASKEIMKTIGDLIAEEKEVVEIKIEKGPYIPDDAFIKV